MFSTKNSRNFKFRSFFFISVALLLSMGATAQNYPPPLENEFPFDYDMRMYAADYGISVEEAKRRYGLTDKVRYLEALLSREESATFAGLWLEQKPKFQVVVQFSGKSKKNISAYIHSRNVAEIIEVRTTAVSLAELKKKRTKAEASITKAGIIFESDINIEKNRVELYATKPNNLKKSKIIKKLNLQLPKNVVLIQVQGLSKPQTSVYGGLTVKEPSLTPCTTGFSVISDSTISGAPIGTRGITTAGHCDSPLTYNGTTLTQRKKVDQGRLDIQWLTNSNLKPTNRVQWGPNNLTRDIIGEKNYSAQLKAERVCQGDRI